MGDGAMELVARLPVEEQRRRAQWGQLCLERERAQQLVNEYAGYAARDEAGPAVRQVLRVAIGKLQAAQVKLECFKRGVGDGSF